MQGLKNSVGQMKVKTYFLTIAFYNFSPSYRIFQKLVYIRIRLILVATKNLEKNYRPESEILAAHGSRSSKFLETSHFMIASKSKVPEDGKNRSSSNNNNNNNIYRRNKEREKLVPTFMF